jgi:hypothetical protein
MKTRYYLLFPDNRITILTTVEGEDAARNVELAFEQSPPTSGARLLNDSDLYKLIAQATEALNTKPY